jgi:hypothetical protein
MFSAKICVGVDPLLFVLLQPDLLNSWVETLARVAQFPNFLNVPPGTSSDNKTLVNKAYEDMIEDSQINLANLLDALKSIAGGSFPSGIFLASPSGMLLTLSQRWNGGEATGH